MRQKMPLGGELIGASYAVRGQISNQEGIRLLGRVIRQVKMKPYGDPIVREWPGEGGVGGSGVTIIQSLVESFAVIETWKELDGFYLVIHSCRRFDPYFVWNLLERLGFSVVSVDGSLVQLTSKRSFLGWLRKWLGG